MRILAFDVGTVRLGVAISDPLGYTAQPLPTLEGGGARRVAKTILELIKKQENSERDFDKVSTILIGHPIHMDGRASQMSDMTEECARLLIEYIRQNIKREIEVILKDERLTSVAAEKVMLASGARREDRRAKKDQVVAQIMLQGYLDAKRNV